MLNDKFEVSFPPRRRHPKLQFFDSKTLLLVLQTRCVQLLAKEHLYKLLAPGSKPPKRKNDDTPGEAEPKAKAKAKAKAKGSPKKEPKKKRTE